MKTLQKGLQLILAVLAFGFVTVAQAIPQLQFDGKLTYNSAGGSLSIVGELTGSTDISPVPILPGSFVLNADFDSVDSSSMPGATFGDFKGLGGSELVVSDSSPSSLLIADLVSLQMGGPDGSTSGIIEGVFSAVSGSLLPEFSTSNLFAFVLNLNTTFSATMYDTDFMGQADGDLTAVPSPEPGILAILSLGLGLVAFRVRRRAV